MTRLDVAILDASSRGGLVCAQALGPRGLAVGAFDAYHTPAFRSRWTRVTGPLPVHEDQERYVEAVLELVEEYSPRVVIPLHDGGIEALRARREDVDRVTSLALTGNEGLARAIDKSQTLAVAERLGIAIPFGITLEPGDDPWTAARAVGFPLVVKPVQSWVPGLADRLSSVFVLDETRFGLAADGPLRAATVVVQPWLPGRREAVWLFVADGKVWARFAQVAHRMYPALGGVSVVRESILPPDDILGPSEALVQELGLEGFSEVEFRRDDQGRPFLMEINPRLSASVELAVRAGVDFPGLLYDWAAGLPLSPVNTYRVGLRMRWLGGDIKWLIQTLASRRGAPPDMPSRLRALLEFGVDCFRPAAYDYARVSDPGPALSATGGFLRRGVATRGRMTAQSNPRPEVPT